MIPLQAKYTAMMRCGMVRTVALMKGLAALIVVNHGFTETKNTTTVYIELRMCSDHGWKDEKAMLSKYEIYVK